MTNNPLVQNLQTPTAYDHPIERFKMLETHVSWVILTGPCAYKLKKPVDFEFLNYSTLEKRKFYCEEEVRLNQPFAPELYLGVVSINGDINNPKINGAGPVLDYAVKIREFPEGSLFSEVLTRKELTGELVDQLAKLIAEFHQQTPAASVDNIYGTPEHVHAPVIQNFDQIIEFLKEDKDREQLARLRTWSEQQYKQHYKLLTDRKAHGFIRECHGDLHLGNIILFNNKPLLFDRIEFNDDFRWTDTIADIAFLAMDFDDKQQPIFARRVVNSYLSYTGDYAGAALLPYYLAYRAIVRAKVTLFSLYSVGENKVEQEKLWQQYRKFMNLAERYTQVNSPVLFITHGLSGSGKSTVAAELVEQLGVMQIRSDVERKRLFDLPANAKTNSDILGGIYHPDNTQKTYDHLAKLAEIIIHAGYSVVVDATFLKAAQREQFQQLAKKLFVPFVILHCEAPRAQLEQWLQERKAKQHEPSEAGLEVLALLEKDMEVLTPAEQKITFVIQTANADAKHVIQKLQEFISK